MSMRIGLALATALGLSVVGVGAPAMAAFVANGTPCVVGTTNCVADDPDDPAAGHIAIPATTVTTTTYNSDNNGSTSVTTPVSTPRTPSYD